MGDASASPSQGPVRFEIERFQSDLMREMFFEEASELLASLEKGLGNLEAVALASGAARPEGSYR